jgi:hypothetical protein
MKEENEAEKVERGEKERGIRYRKEPMLEGEFQLSIQRESTMQPCVSTWTNGRWIRMSFSLSLQRKGSALRIII